MKHRIAVGLLLIQYILLFKKKKECFWCCNWFFCFGKMSAFDIPRARIVCFLNMYGVFIHPFIGGPNYCYLVVGKQRLRWTRWRLKYVGRFGVGNGLWGIMWSKNIFTHCGVCIHETSTRFQALSWMLGIQRWIWYCPPFSLNSSKTCRWRSPHCGIVMNIC